MDRIECDGGGPEKEPRYPPMCGIQKMLRVVSKVGPNRGREFFACPKPIGAQCQGELKCCDEPTAPTLVTWEAKSEEKSYQVGT